MGNNFISVNQFSVAVSIRDMSQRNIRRILASFAYKLAIFDYQRLITSPIKNSYL